MVEEIGVEGVVAEVEAEGEVGEGGMLRDRLVRRAHRRVEEEKRRIRGQGRIIIGGISVRGRWLEEGFRDEGATV